MIARSIKVKLREKNRQKMKELGSTLAEGSFRALIIDYFNLILGVKQSESDQFWRNWLKEILQQKFINCLSETESDPQYDLRQTITLVELFKM